MIITITKLDSSSIDKFSYDTINSEMLIEYKGGSQYLYKKVNEIVVTEFIDAESKGKYINEIKSDYDFGKIGNEVEVTGTSSLQK